MALKIDSKQTKQNKQINSVTLYFSKNGNLDVSIFADDVYVNDCNGDAFFDEYPNVFFCDISENTESHIAHEKNLEGELIALTKNFKNQCFVLINELGELIIFDRNSYKYYIDESDGNLYYDYCREKPFALLQENGYYILQENRGLIFLENSNNV